MNTYQRLQMVQLRHEIEVACERAVRAAVREVLAAWDDVDVTDDATWDVLADIEALRPRDDEAARL